MGWQQLRNKEFYYRNKRIDGRVHSLYLGNGETAERVAAEVAATKAKRLADQTALAELQAKLTEVDQLAADASYGVSLLTEAVLLIAGLHERKGEWRQRSD